MQIDRRITNGLAWAGAVLVVGVPLADFALRQASPPTTAQVAVVQEDVGTATPAPVAQQPASTNSQSSEAEVEEQATDPVVTATASPDNDDAVDSFIQSGKALPSYISGGTSSPAKPAQPSQQVAAAPTSPAPVSPQPTTTTTPRPASSTPVATTPQPAVAAPVDTAAARPETTAVTRPATTPVTLPTPVSQRPTPVAASQARPAQTPQAPALIVEEPREAGNGIITAQELDEWETGPLSEFLANRRGGEEAPVSDYDGDGFFLDEGPDGQQQFPRAYGEGFYYPLSQ